MVPIRIESSLRFMFGRCFVVLQSSHRERGIVVCLFLTVPWVGMQCVIVTLLALSCTVSELAFIKIGIDA